ncbi:CoA-disulfide reductase [Bacillus solimangrovi]|uniref:CoA-disulfide reductase n=1 Tax=Bacillus solimangrovi TaxID=1305675 RepID=A0A1E5LBK9_9BACI|nr:CoA-disulfide reductase [Bacillus solimangrovi]OEH91379.1 CoA-disulfide reductase [Bacillus solimangrovi]
MSKKILIVGGVAGGATAASRLRRLDENAEIILFERGEYISFANCGLPYYIGGIINEREKLLVQTVERMEKRFRIDIRIKSEVTVINRAEKKITIKKTDSGETYEEHYDTLILSPGAAPIKPPIPGIRDANNLFTLRNIPDTDRIVNYVKETKPKRAVVIGGGFIGIEMAENLVERGIDVTLIEMANQLLGPLDYEMATIIHKHVEQNGIKLILEDGVKGFEENGKTVSLNSGKKITTDMVILAIGVSPENKLAKDAGLSLGKRGGIQVNQHLQTSDNSIYAIGDAIEVTDYINSQPTQIPLAWPANRQGRLVADHICGKEASYNGTLGTSIVKVFDLTAASTGNNEKTLKTLNIPHQMVHVHPGSHAGYYPGAYPISLKLLFSKDDGKILGAQAVGKEGVDKRIDVIATAIKAGLTVRDLPDLELSYAPPFSSAKDPVNMAGYAATNILEGDTTNIQWYELHQLIENEKGFIVDVREPNEYKNGNIMNSINIPLDQIRDRLDEFPKNDQIYVYCQVGLRGYLATQILKQHGFNVTNLDGGYKTYSTVYE